MTITLEDMQSKLVSLNDVHVLLEQTEPLGTEFISNDAAVSIHLEDDWATGIDALKGTDIVGATMTINGTERQMTKESINQAAANFGLTAPYIKKVPAPHIERLLNWHYGAGMGKAEYNVLTVQDRISAFTRPTVSPFSNIQLLDAAVAGIQRRYGAGTEVFADYKIHNSLLKTDVRLIVPAEDRIIRAGNLDDVPEGGEDVWYAGVHLSNSLVGKGQTTLESYLFRWWCTNGATSRPEGSSVWSRRVNGQQDDVYEWAREQVDEILGGMERQFDAVQSLVGLHTAGNTVDILQEIFKDYEVPVSQREAISLRLLEAETLTMYSIMNAITQVANEADMADARRDKLMRIGGAIPTETFDTLKDKVWREGHSADPDAISPYAMRRIAV